MRIKILDGSKNSGFLQGSTVSNIRREDEGGKTNTFIVDHHDNNIHLKPLGAEKI